MSFTNVKPYVIAHLQCGTIDTSNFLLTLFRTDIGFAQTGSGGYSLNGSGFDVRPYADALLTNPLRYYLVRYNGTTGVIFMIIEKPTLSVSADGTVYMAAGNASLTSDGSDATIFANYSGWYSLGDGTTLSLVDLANGKNLTNAGATAAAGLVDGGARIQGDWSTSTYPFLSRNNASDFDYGISSFSFRVAAKFGTQTSGANNYPAIVGKQDNDGVTDRGWLLRIDTGGGGTDNHVQLVLYDGGGGLDFVDSLVALNDNQEHIYHGTIDHVNDRIDLFIDGAQANGHTPLSAGTVTSPFNFCIGARSFMSAFVFDAYNGYADEVYLSAPGVVWTPSQITAEYNMQKSGSTFFTDGAWSPTVVDSLEWRGQFPIIRGLHARAVNVGY